MCLPLSQGRHQAGNFWSPTSHSQSNAHSKCFPTCVPQGDAVGQLWQMFQHEDHTIFFNHATLELVVE